MSDRTDDEIRADLSYAAKGAATYRRLAGDVPALLARAVAAEQRAEQYEAAMSPHAVEVALLRSLGIGQTYLRNLERIGASEETMRAARKATDAD